VTLTVAGIGAMANRAAVAASIAPVNGPGAEVMTRETVQAERMLADDLAVRGLDPVRITCLDPLASIPGERRGRNAAAWFAGVLACPEVLPGRGCRHLNELTGTSARSSSLLFLAGPGRDR